MKRSFAALLAMMIVVVMMPFQTAATAVEEPVNVESASVSLNTISVAVYDYAAVSEGFGVSKTGVILPPYQITVSANTTAMDVVKKTLSENNIAYTMTESGYVSDIAGLGPNYDPKYTPADGGYNMTGWTLSYNDDDFANYGLSALSLKNGDKLEFHYQLFGEEIASAWNGLPTMKTMKVGATEISFSTKIEYDAEYNPVSSYNATGQDVIFTGSGTKDMPFAVEVKLAADTDMTKVPVSYETMALEPYRSVEGLSDTMDLTKDVNFSITSKGNRTAYYVLKASQAEAEKLVIKGVKSSYQKTYGSKAFTLNAKCDATLIFKSSDTKVATVNQKGKVTIKGCGKTTITIRTKADADKATTKKVTITVVPKKQSMTVKAAKNEMQIKLAKNAGISGYQITYATTSKFTAKKTKNVNVKATGKKAVNKTIKKLKKNQNYWVKVRAYATYKNKKYFGAYSAVKKVKVK